MKCRYHIRKNKAIDICPIKTLYSTMHPPHLCIASLKCWHTMLLGYVSSSVWSAWFTWDFPILVFIFNSRVAMRMCMDSNIYTNNFRDYDIYLFYNGSHRVLFFLYITYWLNKTGLWTEQNRTKNRNVLFSMLYFLLRHKSHQK